MGRADRRGAGRVRGAGRLTLVGPLPTRCARGHGARAGYAQRLGAAHRAAEDERALQQAQHRERELARLLACDAGRCEVRGRAGDPAVEHLGAGFAQRLVGARDLERHRRDRAGVGVVGLLERLGGAGEEVARPR